MGRAERVLAVRGSLVWKADDLFSLSGCQYGQLGEKQTNKQKGISCEDTSKPRVRMNTCFSYGGQPSKNKSVLQFQHTLLVPLIAKEHK